MMRTLKKLLPMLALFVLGAAVGVLAARTGFDMLPELGFTGAQTALFVGSLPVVYLLSVAIHEAGHVAGGVLAGFRTLLFIVGPFRLDRTERGFRPGFNHNVLLAGGLAGMTPVGLHDLRRRTIIMVAGGPIASMMAGAQFMALYQVAASSLLADGAGFAARFSAITLLLLGLLSLLIGFATLLPARSGGFYSDGARMLRLMRTTDETEREVALLALTGLTMAGTRPRDWDSGLVESGAGIRDGGPFEVSGRQFAYAHALDRGDIDAARAHLAAALERVVQLPVAARSSLLLAAATFHALYEDDAERARAFLEQARAAGRGMLNAPHQRLLAEAAVRLVEGDVEQARQAAAEVRRMASAAPDRGGAALDAALAGRILGDA